MGDPKTSETNPCIATIYRLESPCIAYYIFKKSCETGSSQYFLSGRGWSDRCSVLGYFKSPVDAVESFREIYEEELLDQSDKFFPQRIDRE